MGRCQNGQKMGIAYKEVEPPVKDIDEMEFSGSFVPEKSEDDINQEAVRQKQAASRAQRLEAELKNRWEFRYNDVKGQTEFRPVKKPPVKFKPLTDYDLNSMIRELKNKGIPGTSRETIKMLIKSDFCEKINPLHEYFTKLETDNQDYISKLASTVKMQGAPHWPKYLRKWLIAVVAGALNEDMTQCKNHTCLVFCGNQGVGKTTWMMKLCPSELDTYIISPGKMDPDNKDAMMLLSEYFLINIDEQLKTLNKTYENSLKEIITKPSVKYRRPYEAMITEYPHRASFMGSVNGNDFLMDESGSRRFLPFEVETIDWEAFNKIKIQDVWAQAYRALKNGERYWFDQEEINELTINNDRFHVVTVEEELILEYFTPVPREHATHNYTTSRIMVHIEGFTHQRLRKKFLTSALRKLGFEYFQKREGDERSKVWAVKELDPYEREKMQKNSPKEMF